MVDSVNVKSPANQAVEQKNSQTNSPRASLDTIKVKAVVETAMRSADVVVNIDGARSTEKVTRTLKDLNDAVAHSTAALDALGRIAGEDSAQLVQGVDALKHNISGVLDSLRERVGRAEVLSENINSASSRLEDLDAATRQAGDLKLQMPFDDRGAVDVHKGLSRERVLQLLSD